jgi:hypothetical protein
MVQAVVQTTVTGLQGNPVSATPPTANQGLAWNGTTWAPSGPFLPVAGGAVTGNVSIGGTLNVSGAGTFANQLNVAAGLSSFAGGAAVAGGMTIQSSWLAFAGSSSLQSGFVIQAVPGGILCPQWGSGTSNSYNTGTGLRLWSFNSVNIMSLDSAGNLGIVGALSQGSDATNKININPIATGISIVRQLLPKSFQFNTPANAPVQWGFIAQDVQAVVPSAVTEGLNDTLGLNITAIVAAVTLAVKQLDSRVSAIESHDGITPPAQELA